MEKIKVSKIEIEISGMKLELSIKEAHELRDVLNETFPVKCVQFPSPCPYPCPYYVSPATVWSPPVEPFNPPEITSTTDDNSCTSSDKFNVDHGL